MRLTFNVLIKRLGLALLLTSFCWTASWAQEKNTFNNPLLPDGPDPWVTVADGFYYYMHTQGDRLTIWKTNDITQLNNAYSKTIWTPPAKGPNSKSIWAPELHRLNKKWYVYYTATDVDHNSDETRYVFVLENSSSDPLEGEWIDIGKLNTHFSGLDGSVFEHKGKIYFLYSAYVGSQSNLIICSMINPWTLSEEQIQIAGPTHYWEKFGNREILEGPEFLKGKNGKLFIVYSASACWADEYALGLLEANDESDLMNAASWAKHPDPVFKQSAENKVYGPGHNAFFKSPDGKEDWIIYHGKSQPNLQCTKRSPRTQPFAWSADGTPDFGEPVSIDMPLKKPSMGK